MSKPYRKAKGYWWIWLLCVFGGIAVGFTAVAQFPKDAGPWIFAVVGGPILLGIITGAVLDRKLTKGRQKRVGAFLELLGLNFILDPEPDVKQAFFSQVQQLEQNAALRSGGANLQWIAYGAIQGRQALIFEHMYVAGSGRTTQVQEHTAVCWVGNQPWLTLLRPRVGEGRALERSHPELHVADERFDKNWIIWGEQAGIDILTDSFRARLADSPRGEMWCFGGGWACCLFKYPLDPSNLANFIQRSGNAVFL
ncbi:MAG: hypothetical protein ABIV13_05395 [Fimbriimonadales bacterium]